MYQSTSYVICVDTHCDLPSGMYINTETPTYSFRTVNSNGKRLLLVGGFDHKTGEKLDLKNNYLNLEIKAKEIYENSETLYKWSTEDCISLDKIPYIGPFSDLMPNMFVGTGFKKWGMTFSNIAANIIADKISGNKNKYENTFLSTRFHPVKNHQEFGNMLKETSYSLVINKLKDSDKSLSNIKNDDGKIIEIDNKKIGAYRDNNGNLHLVKPFCSHLGCELTFNNLEKTWDCPCHGSKFNFDGKSLYSPGINDLEKYDFRLE